MRPNDVINDKEECKQESKVKFRYSNSFLHKTFTEPNTWMSDLISAGHLQILLTFRGEFRMF